MRAVDEATFASLEAEAKTAEVQPLKHAVAPTVLRPSSSRISPRASALQRLSAHPFEETSSVAPPPSSNGHTNGTARRIQFAWLAKAEEVLKLKRTKPLKAWESTLDACINLKVRAN